MRIGIDARFLTHPQRGGFKTYTESLVSALAELDRENEYVLYVDRLPDGKSRVPRQPNFSTRIVPGLLPIVGMPWREQVLLAREAKRNRLDLFHSPSLSAPLQLGCPLVVTIHDMLWLFPHEYSNGISRPVRRRLMEWYYRLIPKLAARRAALVLTVSEASKASIVQHLGLPPNRIIVTYEAASPAYRRLDGVEQIRTVRRKYELASDFILCHGSADPRKNLTTLVEAFALLPGDLRSRYKLAIVWTHSLLESRVSEGIEKLGLADQVKFLKDVADEDMVALYNAATLFVFPSRQEGFGLPLLEAMACATPVVAANNSSIPEVVGDAALLFNAEDAQDMAAKISSVLADKAIQASLRQKGLERAGYFSWDKCASQTIAAYHQALDLARVTGATKKQPGTARSGERGGNL